MSVPLDQSISAIRPIISAIRPIIKHVQQGKGGWQLLYGTILVCIKISKYSRLDLINYDELFCYCGEIWREYDGSKILLLSLEAELHQKISMIQVGIVA